MSVKLTGQTRQGKILGFQTQSTVLGILCVWNPNSIWRWLPVSRCLILTNLFSTCNNNIASWNNTVTMLWITNARRIYTWNVFCWTVISKWCLWEFWHRIMNIIIPVRWQVSAVVLFLAFLYVWIILTIKFPSSSYLLMSGWNFNILCATLRACPVLERYTSVSEVGVFECYHLVSYKTSNEVYCLKWKVQDGERVD